MIESDIKLVIFIIAASIGIAVSIIPARKILSPKWRLISVVPLLGCLILMSIDGFEKAMTGAYIASLLPLLVFVKNTEKTKLVSSALSVICCIITIPVCLGYKGYRAPDYTDDFKKMFHVMRQHYALTYHKQIDWDALYDEYLPKFVSADQNNSYTENLAAWNLFCAEFFDGHVSYMPDDVNDEVQFDIANAKVYEYMGAHDYGFSMMPLTDENKVCAVNVDKNSPAYAAGIRNGTVITAWDGKDIFEAGTTSPVMELQNVPDRDNLRFITPLIASVTGGETVSVSFIAEDGSEKTAKIPSSGNGYDRMDDTSDKVNRGIEAANFEWTQINDKTAAFRMKAMMFDKNSSRQEDYTVMKMELTQKIIDLKSSGTENIIIDIRNNMGGSGNLVLALGEIFAPEGTYYYCTDCLWDDEKHEYVYDPVTDSYGEGNSYYFGGSGIWDGKIIILVNSMSISAGDHFTMVMREMENVTVMGFTKTNGSAQGISSTQGKNGELVFSNSLLLNENHRPSVDSGADRICSTGVDILVPFDREAVTAIFENDEDYLLNKALEQLGQ